MGRQTRKWSSKMSIFVSFAHYIFRIFIPKAAIIIFHRPLKIRTDDGRSRVRELGSIGFLNIFTITLSIVVLL